MEERRAKRTAPRIKASITGKVSEAALRASLKAAKREGFDQSVPTSLRYLGLTLSAEAKPRIRAGDARALSPFVLHLAPAPAPHELLETSQEQPILVNFLANHSVVVPTEAAAENDLALARHEVAAQLGEDRAPASALPWRLPALQIRRPAAPAFSLPVPSDPVAEPLAVETLAPLPAAEPVLAPASLLASLDLPEAEDEEESAIVEFSAGAMIVEQAPEPALEAPKREFAWPKLPKLALPELKMPALMPFGWERAIGAFVLLAFAFVLPIHAMTMVGGLQEAQTQVTAAGSEAIGHLKDAAGAVAAQDPARAKQSFGLATERFQAAQKTIGDLGGTVAFVASAIPKVGGSVRAGTRLIAAGEALSQAGSRLSDGVQAVQESVASPTDRLSVLADYVSSALPLLKEAQGNVNGIDPNDVPAAQREQFLSLADRLPLLVSTLEQFQSFNGALREILGGNGTRKYLAVFQNDTELRPTGGFMGSFAELTVSNGKIVGMTIPGGGTYDVRGSLKDYVAAPDPLRLLSARWEFQDANWFPDFPTSARKILSFYQSSGGPTVDGVIAVNASYVADLLSVLGDVDMPEYGRTITKDNFLPETQKIVEQEYDKTQNRPKAFIGALAPKLLDRVSGLSGKDFLGLLEHVNQGLEHRDIQVYLADNGLEKLVTSLGWDGGIKWTDGDYLMVIDTNLGGGKTDGVIKENVDVLANVASDGSVTNTVTVTRTHTGSPDDPFSGVNNVDYLRLYVPKGSELLRASGFNPPPQELFNQPENGWKIDDDVIYDEQTFARDAESGTDTYQEAGKTVFGNWTQVKPGATASVTFTYRLPFKVLPPQDGGVTRLLKDAAGIPTTSRYTFTLQKQSGKADRTTRFRLELPQTLRTLWTNMDPSDVTFTNETDQFFAALFEGRMP